MDSDVTSRQVIRANFLFCKFLFRFIIIEREKDSHNI